MLHLLPSLLLLLPLALLGCNESEAVTTDQTASSQGGTSSQAGAGAGQGGTSQAGQGAGAGQGGAGNGGSGGVAGGEQGGAGAGASAGAGQGGGATCAGLQLAEAEVSVGKAADLPGSAFFELSRLGASGVVVLSGSEISDSPSNPFHYPQVASLDAAAWPSGEAGPFKGLEKTPLYDLALVPTAEAAPVALLLTITNSASFPMSSIDLAASTATPIASVGPGSDATVASFALRRPGGFVGAASWITSDNGKAVFSTFPMLFKESGESSVGKEPLACTKQGRPRVSGLHRDGETVILAASEAGACTGATGSLRLATISDGDETPSLQLKKEFPPVEGDFYENVFVADGGAGKLWVVSRLMGLNALVQPPVEVRLLDPQGGEVLHFSVSGDQLVSTTMAVSSLGGNLLLALPDASIEGQGTILARVYESTGQMLGEVAVGMPLSAGGPFAFIDRVRLLPLDETSFVLGYQARGAPGAPSTVRLARLGCSAPSP